MSEEQRSSDVYLDVLLDFLNQEKAKGSSLTVTLLMGGALVCGDLIAHAQWQDELQAVLEGAGGDAPLLGRLMKSVEEAAEVLPEELSAHFVHLKNVLIITNYRGTLSGDVPQGIEHPVWRGRLSEVQGWTLGRPA